MKVTEQDLEAIKIAVDMFQSYEDGGNDCETFANDSRKIKRLANKMKKDAKKNSA